MLTTILIAEDDPLIAMTVIDALGDAGFFTVGPFTTTSQALAYCRKHVPDCAVLDVRLEDGESYPLADFLAERDVPVVFHSGDAAQQELARRYPTATICAKPIAASQLTAIVAEVSAHHSRT